MRKSFAVIGLGKFGFGVAKTLADAHQDVMAVDISEERIKEIADDVTYALQADVTEKGVLESMGLSNMDVVVVSISDNMEASILSTIFAKDAGVPHVVVKAMNELHGNILTRIGADEVVYPERSMGVRVAKNLLSGGFSDLFELSPTFSMVEFPVPAKWVGKNLVELRLREVLNVNVVGLRIGDDVRVKVDPQEPLEEGWALIVVGNNEDLKEMLPAENK
ncbi:MAG: potassium channel family protein [Blautia sp.]|jgi:trk system potassium uptake protein TrkA